MVIMGLSVGIGCLEFEGGECTVGNLKIFFFLSEVSKGVLTSSPDSIANFTKKFYLEMRSWNISQKFKSSLSTSSP